MAEGTIRYLDGCSLRITRALGSSTLRIEMDGEMSVLSGRIRRAFPASKPDELFSVQDSSGKEVGILRTLDELDADSRKLVEEQLNRRYFTPKIQEVLSLRQDGGMWLFLVRTQRGEAKFYVRNWRDSCHEVRPGQWVIFSVDGQRYEIPNWEGLSGRSRDILEQLF